MIANHSSGTVQELHLLPLTECGAKVLLIFDICKKNRRKIAFWGDFSYRYVAHRAKLRACGE